MRVLLGTWYCIFEFILARIFGKGVDLDLPLADFGLRNSSSRTIVAV
jgi:hypothetical protein